MENYTYIKLREHLELQQNAADWFHSKWGVPLCMVQGDGEPHMTRMYIHR